MGTKRPPLLRAAAATRARYALSQEEVGRAPGPLVPRRAAPSPTPGLWSRRLHSSRRGRPAQARPGCAAQWDDWERSNAELQLPADRAERAGCGLSQPTGLTIGALIIYSCEIARGFGSHAAPPLAQSSTRRT
ncbi:hypothetical protein NDU88_006362 [Pleurodeles waltl]|uniref:Uncharacterized protein n=1 Tax=Pleurodeles waltl TaxID=8319 RepID=A0AAV7X3H9_PLEWA|nr:hypothetical protein NDU88_006362 [Pleurodeles waltl]